jgi:phosphate transport system protein
MSTAHLDAAMARDLDALRQRLSGMAALVRAALDHAQEALRSRDRSTAWRVILEDNRIDELEGRIDRLCQEFLVRHMPAGTDLRFVIAAIKVNAELERIGDYAEAIARRVVALHGRGELPAVSAVLDMARLAIGAVDQAVTAFLGGDADAATATLGIEGNVDARNRAIFDALAHPEHGERDLEARFAVLGVLNRIERIADRAVNIAEHAAWAARGEVRRHNAERERRVLFISPADATIGPMAEAMGRARAPLHVSFSSCGLEPRPLDPRLVAYMSGRGVDVKRPRARSIADAGAMEEYSVVVLLSAAVEERCPALPYRTVRLTWDIEDPAGVADADAAAAYSRIYDELAAKIDDLVSALCGGHVQPLEVT